MSTLRPPSHPLALQRGHILGAEFSSLFYIVPQQGFGDDSESTKRLPCSWEPLSSYLQIHTKPAQAPHPYTPPGRWKAEAREFPEARGLAVNNTETLSQSKMEGGDQHGLFCDLPVSTRDCGGLCSATYKHELTHKMPQHLNLSYTVPPPPCA